MVVLSCVLPCSACSQHHVGLPHQLVHHPLVTLHLPRQLVAAHDGTPDWTPLATQTTLPGLDEVAATLLDPEVFAAEGSFDALSRPVTRTTPDASVTRYTYNEAGLLESVSARLRVLWSLARFIRCRVNSSFALRVTVSRSARLSPR